MLRIINDNDYIELKEICDQVREGKLILDIVNRHQQEEVVEIEELLVPEKEPVEIKKNKKTTKK